MMHLIKTGKYNRLSPITPKWNECLFVDIWDNYHLFTDAKGTTFEYRLKKYMDCHSERFYENYIRIIHNGSIDDYPTYSS